MLVDFQKAKNLVFFKILFESLATCRVFEISHVFTTSRVFTTSLVFTTSRVFQGHSILHAKPFGIIKGLMNENDFSLPYVFNKVLVLRHFAVLH